MKKSFLKSVLFLVPLSLLFLPVSSFVTGCFQETIEILDFNIAEFDDATNGEIVISKKANSYRGAIYEKICTIVDVVPDVGIKTANWNIRAFDFSTYSELPLPRGVSIAKKTGCLKIDNSATANKFYLCIEASPIEQDNFKKCLVYIVNIKVA